MLLSWRPQQRNRDKTLAPRRAIRPRERSNLFRPQVEQLEDRRLLSVDPILEWNAVAIESDRIDHSRPPGTTAPDQGGPTRASRALAIVHAAMFDAYNSVNPQYTPYLLRIPVNRSTSADAAVAQAARDTLVALYPQQEDTFNAALSATLERVPDGAAEDRGRVVGRLVALAILFDRLGDDSNDDQPYTPRNRSGFHNADPLHPDQGFLTSKWGDVDTFVLNSSTQIPVRDLDDGSVSGRARFLRSSEYTAAYNEVRVLGAVDAETADRDGNGQPDRTPEQTEIGIYWAYDGSNGLGTPPRLYNQIVRTIAVQEGNTVAENARLFALVNLAMGDAGIASWGAKYDHDFWRPIMGIRQTGPNGEFLDDRNPNTPREVNWSPLGAQASNAFEGQTDFTPPFPAYPSGHATFGGAVFQTLARFYGRDDISFTFTSDELNGVTRDQNGNVRPLSPRSFDSFTEAKEENAQSRIYLGIHWQFDATEGIRQGDRIANFVFNNALRPLDRDFGDFTTTNTAPDANLIGALGGGGTMVTSDGVTEDPALTPGGTAEPSTPASGDSGASTSPTPVETGEGTGTVDATDLLFQFPELFADDIV